MCTSTHLLAKIGDFRIILQETAAMSLLDKEVINPAQTMSGIIWHSDEHKDGETALELKFNIVFYDFMTSCCSWIYLLIIKNDSNKVFIISLAQQR